MVIRRQKLGRLILFLSFFLSLANFSTCYENSSDECVMCDEWIGLDGLGWADVKTEFIGALWFGNGWFCLCSCGWMRNAEAQWREGSSNSDCNSPLEHA